jgi:hypothetical protein
MKNYLLPALLMSLWTAACGNTDEVGVGEIRQTATTLENLNLVSPIIRGFVADGTGCSTLGDPIINGNTITFILTDYIAEKEGTGRDRATCDIPVDVDPPPGVTISLDDVIYRGFADGSLSRSTFFREYFFAGVFLGDRRFTVIDYNAAGVPNVIRNDSDNYMSDFGEFTALDEVMSVGASKCGEPAIWRANTSLSVRNNVAASFSLTSIDTIDVSNQYFITFDFGNPRGC